MSLPSLRLRARPGRSWRLGIFCAVLGCLFGLGPVEAETLAVHLPSHGAENAGSLARGLDRLAAHLSESVDGLELEIEIFRRQEDMAAFLARSADVALVLSDASWLQDPPVELTPLGATTLGGKDTYRRVVVVPASSSARRLADLQGGPLTVVRTGADEEFLERWVFSGELDPTAYFSELRYTIDGAEAVTDVLFGQASAALVAEHTALLAANRNDKLRVIFESPPLPLPRISMRTGALDDARRDQVVAALERLSGDPSGALGDLGFDGMVPAERPAPPPGASGRTLGTARVGTFEGKAPSVPEAQALPLPFVVVLPELATSSAEPSTETPSSEKPPGGP